MRADSAIYTAFDDYVGLDSAEPEKNLMRSVLRSALEDIAKSGEAYRDARVFFTTNEDRYLFSFISICLHLNLCPYTIRHLLGLTSSGENGAHRMAA